MNSLRKLATVDCDLEGAGGVGETATPAGSFEVISGAGVEGLGQCLGVHF